MELRQHFITIIQLIGLLWLLFWTCTWNLPENYGVSESRKSLKIVHENNQKDISDAIDWTKQSVVVETFKTVKYVGNNDWRSSVAGNSLLPPFNAWKEEELTKQEKIELQDKISVPRTSRRKLNYASSKCGAKILGSNRESKHRMSILNEKIDEYMLNPCRVTAWFIVELCDTIEATQIELANYELYSSSPKKFFLYWSSVYPTQKWQHLGTFEAKDKRSMQTFNLDSWNLGKFIKVVISSHHGREHYCPLSVFRVVGYSMVYEYDDIEEENEHRSRKLLEKNGTDYVKSKEMISDFLNDNSSIQQVDTDVERKLHSRADSQSVKLCHLEHQYCSYHKSNKASLDRLACLFFRRVILQNETDCGKVWTRKSTDNFNSDHRSNSKISDLKSKIRSSVSNGNNISKNNNIINNETGKNINALLDFHNSSSSSMKSSLQSTDFTNESGFNRTVENLLPSSVKSSHKNKITNIENHSSPNNSKVRNDEGNGYEMNKTLSKDSAYLNKKEDNRSSNSQCNCAKVANTDDRKSPEGKTSEILQFEFEEKDATDSAALIQKESVLVKLTMRIKTSETNLDLINKYLQQLSESYRKQMEEMLSLFNETVKAIWTASDKADTSDERQEFALDQLKNQVDSLSFKVHYLEIGQKDILKRVLELHGFFFILECIIMSTIFTVMFNIFKHS